jgi:hypothetical protein
LGPDSACNELGDGAVRLALDSLALRHRQLTFPPFRSLSPNRFPFEHSLQEAEAATTTAGPAKRDPFIYNPKRAGSAAKVRPTLVQNESAEVFLTLQNPFLFDLEIQSIVLR